MLLAIRQTRSRRAFFTLLLVTSTAAAAPAPEPGGTTTAPDPAPSAQSPPGQEPSAPTAPPPTDPGDIAPEATAATNVPTALVPAPTGGAPNAEDAADTALPAPKAADGAPGDDERPTTTASSEVPPERSTVRAGLGEGFSIATPDEKQSLRIDALLSVRASVTGSDGEDATVGAVPRLARPILRGNLDGPELSYFFQAELAGTARLLDIELAYRPLPEFGIRAGRIRVPVGRQWITGLNVLMLPDRSIVSDTFRPDRDTGVTLESHAFDGILEAHLGAYGEDLDRWPHFAARLAVSPLGAMPYSEDTNLVAGPPRLSLGVGGAVDKATPTTTSVDLTTGEIVTAPGPSTARAVGSVDLAVTAGNFAGFAEGHLDRTNPDGSRAFVRAGTFVELGYFVLPKRLEAAARFDLIVPDVDQSDQLRRFEIGPGYYWFDDALKLQARYARTQLSGASAALPPAGHAFDLQFVLMI